MVSGQYPYLSGQRTADSGVDSEQWTVDNQWVVIVGVAIWGVGTMIRRCGQAVSFCLLARCVDFMETSMIIGG